jgi:hypothetical protein
MHHLNEMAEINIGQHFSGPVHDNTFVLNIGGQTRQLCEISHPQLKQVRKVLMGAISFRTKLTMAPRLIMVAAVFLLWLHIPSAVAHVGSLTDPVVAVATALMGVLSMAAAWAVVHLHFGAWLRRHRNTIAELESVLSRIDAELDMRKPLSEFGNLALLRALFSPGRMKFTEHLRLAN